MIKEEPKKEEDKLVKQLIQNDVSLQSKLVDLLKAMADLTKKIDRILSIFEEASKQVKEVKGMDEQLASLATKLEALLEQNKNLAKGLILLERYVRGRTEITVPPKPLTEYSKL